MKPTASLIILTYNNLEYTQQCLESIYTFTDAPEFEVILVDNASSDGTPEFLVAFASQHPDVQLILNSSNTGFAHGNNQAASAAHGDYLVFLNNDIVVTRGWLAGLINHLQADTVGMVGPVTNFAGNESRIRTDYLDLEQMHYFAQQYTRAHQGRVFEINMLAFFCVAMRRAVFWECGGLDERYKIGMFEDDDFARKLRGKGYQLLCAEDVFVHHWGNASFARLSFAEYWQTYRHNRQLYEEKWGVPWQPQRYRDELLDQLLSQLVDGQASLAEQIIAQERAISHRNQLLADKEARNEALEHRLAELEGQLISLGKFAAIRLEENRPGNTDFFKNERETTTLIKTLVELVEDKNIVIQKQRNLLQQQQQLVAEIAERDRQISSLQNQIAEIHRSKSWRLILSIRCMLEPWRKVTGKNQTDASDNRSSPLIARSIVNKVVHRLPPIFAASWGGDLQTIRAINTSEIAAERVVIATYTFFDLDGGVVFLGGAERYVIELSRLIRELGYVPEIWQCGNAHWERKYGDLKVIGLDAGGDFRVFEHLLKAHTPAARLIIYSPFSIAARAVNIPALGISHGVYWDTEANGDSPRKNRRMTANLIRSLRCLDKIISVDTNTINWVRTTAHPLANKFNYIPNFVDLDSFQPAAEKNTDRLVILYPRRLYAPRGFYLLAEAMPAILEAYPQAEFHLVGQAIEPEKTLVKQLIDHFPGRIKHYQLPMERMQEAYRQADIAVIPTLHSEGTSLSCLEALASGNAVIATNVGGLPDLILSGFNGVLIEPDSSALVGALQQLIEDEDLRLRLSHNGREAVSSFSLERWREQWRACLLNYLPRRTPEAVVFNFANGFLWEGIHQRPHHLALQFARSGLETYWLNRNGHRPDPAARLHILDWQEKIHLSRPVFFIYYPFSYEEIKQYDHPIVVYDVLDDISIHDTPGENLAGTQARQYHQMLIEQADLVVVSSRRLYDQVKPLRSDLIYAPNGVDLEHFNPDFVISSPELDRYQRPLIGYHGAIATWFDGELLAQVSRLRPQYDFVLIGPLADERVKSALDALPNVHLLGPVPYDHLPPYIAGFDACILPFRVNSLTNAVRPLKVLECLAMRKPIVATPLDEIRDWPGVVLAADPQQFVEAIDSAVAHGPAQSITPAVAQFLRESSWERTVKPLIDAILSHP